ncbi:MULTISPECIES: hypothetical protein [unclassified Streptomyces]|nr:hypothetical protein [Streptomyces sp. 13-12-16]
MDRTVLPADGAPLRTGTEKDRESVPAAGTGREASGERPLGDDVPARLRA